MPREMSRYLEERVANDTTSVQGSLSVELLAIDNCCIGILLNASHALVDGRSLTHVVSVIAETQHQEPHPSIVDPASRLERDGV
mmetsp:Transcript_7120/g.12374  ORF Transcript_7120/g.12374 Transcript_7120/m.12374 type:complete len:84 (-) Transcript_7120:486-737(-)